MLKKIKKIDNLIFVKITRIYSEKLNKLMIFFTNLGSNSAIWLFVALVCLFYKETRKAGIRTFVTVGFAALIGEGILKPIFCRIRPCEYISKNHMLIKKPITYSFPSGHATSSFAGACTLAGYFNSYLIPLVFTALIISFSRLYLRVHYLSDILAGIILGISCSFIIKKLI